tara:strand:- start:2254 stop:2892 length:639 start_codon:yes stop_codon:yes gene_type:complete
MQFRFSTDIDKLTKAIVKAKSDMGQETIQYDATNPHFRNKFASLEACVKNINPHLSKNGLALMQFPTGTHLINMLSHESGQWLCASYKLSPVKNDPQGIGSALTYARRYSICAIFNVSGSEDDDGEMAQGNQGNNPTTSGPKKSAKEIFESIVKDNALKTVADLEEFMGGKNWTSTMSLAKNNADRQILAKMFESAKKDTSLMTKVLTPSNF